jgi:Zn finger protein HypA/HybF involved in hydrogenase expression
MKYLAICHDCGKLLGETQEFDEKELKDNMGQVIKLASFSFKECPRCGSEKINLKKDEINFGNEEN